MAELLARFGVDDEQLLRRVLGVDTDGATRAAPDRVVVDAHASVRAPNLALLAQQAGRPFLVDPQTFYLQDAQHADLPWVKLPYGRAEALTPGDLSSTVALDELVERCVGFQIENAATAVIPPYVHIEKVDSGWLDVQIALWDRTARHLRRTGIRLPVIAVVAVGWTTLAREVRTRGMTLLVSALQRLAPTEIALAASKVDEGSRPADRLADFISTIRYLRRVAPVIAWQQGVLGEAAVAGGAIGYECGIGWRERCHLQSSMAVHRNAPREDSQFGGRPIYISQLGRSLPKRTVRELLEHRQISPAVLCLDPDCCPRGRDSLLGDAREHTLTARRRDLAELSRISRPAWQWRLLADRADRGLVVAERINAYVVDRPAGTVVTSINTGALRAVQAVGHNRRQTLRRRKVAA